ncbi:hypothetical protein [Aurantimonas coralicida]|nr:hypothetical protein [Aurantimonas coralicida]
MDSSALLSAVNSIGDPFSAMQNKQELAEYIKEACRNHWHEHHYALLLTQLGTQISAELKKFAPKGVKNFIETELVDELDVVPDLNATGKFGVVPKDAELPGDRAELFRPPVRRYANIGAKQDSTKHIIYHRGLWKAFRDPLALGFHRYWNKDKPESYQDSTTGDATDPRLIKIPQDLIGSDSVMDGTPKPDVLRERIRKFIMSRNEDESDFIDRVFDENERRVARTTNASLENISIGDAINRLSRSDQARIMIPLDIVAELLKKY